MKDNFWLTVAYADFPNRKEEGGAGKRLTPAIKRWMKDQNAAGKKGTKGFDSKKRKGIGKCCQDIVARFSNLLATLHSNSEQNVFVSVRETGRRSQKKINRVRLILPGPSILFLLSYRRGKETSRVIGACLKYVSVQLVLIKFEDKKGKPECVHKRPILFFEFSSWFFAHDSFFWQIEISAICWELLFSKKSLGSSRVSPIVSTPTPK